MSWNQSNAASTTGAVVPPLSANRPTFGLAMPASAADRPTGVKVCPSAENAAVRFVPSLVSRTYTASPAGAAVLSAPSLRGVPAVSRMNSTRARAGVEQVHLGVVVVVAVDDQAGLLVVRRRPAAVTFVVACQAPVGAGCSTRLVASLRLP